MKGQIYVYESSDAKGNRRVTITNFNEGSMEFMLDQEGNGFQIKSSKTLEDHFGCPVEMVLSAWPVDVIVR